MSIPGRGLDVRAYYTPPRAERGGVFVLHHGAGYSGTSFACLAKELVDLTKGEVGVLAFDARRHGSSSFTLLEVPTSIMCRRQDDGYGIGRKSVHRYSGRGFMCAYPESIPSTSHRTRSHGIVVSPHPKEIHLISRPSQLVGHSMGGSVVVRACPKLLEWKYMVSGVAVLDVVEGEQMGFPTSAVYVLDVLVMQAPLWKPCLICMPS